MFDGKFKNDHVYLVAKRDGDNFNYLGFYAKINFAVKVDNTLSNNQLICIQSIDIDNAPKALKTTEFYDDSDYVVAAEVDESFITRYSVVDIPKYVISRLERNFEEEIALKKLFSHMVSISESMRAEGRTAFDNVTVMFSGAEIDLLCQLAAESVKRQAILSAS